ncbi:GntR family transcriptional regulator [Rhodococcus sp. Eu-32]|uniref:GntR family transcriptional regulator n=1 Tax=Rhodococcus sp. Eu-32 TaxID=1017319 RepID=UPI000DF1A519|nr:GntR family transcriptional regulator [Rhodococcus sp. Eu-32]RRQ26583.1 GntR family transcriptional regulator [Rhodococcus sp. Eu-32]
MAPTRPGPSSAPEPERVTAIDSASVQYARLRAELVDHVFPPGTVLLETMLSARYGVSRTPIRDALTRLEHDGLVERVVRGYRIRVATAEDIMELYEARIALESAAASAAALRRTELDLARLEHLAELLSEATEIEEISSVNADWHRTLWTAAHNSVLSDLLDRVITQMRLFDDSPVGAPNSLEKTVAEHEAILVALRANDAEAARVGVIAHLSRTRDVRLAKLAQVRP